MAASENLKDPSIRMAKPGRPTEVPIPRVVPEVPNPFPTPIPEKNPVPMPVAPSIPSTPAPAKT